MEEELIAKLKGTVFLSAKDFHIPLCLQYKSQKLLPFPPQNFLSYRRQDSNRYKSIFAYFYLKSYQHITKVSKDYFIKPKSMTFLTENSSG